MFFEEATLGTAVVLKRLAAIFLSIALFLPLSECTVPQKPEAKSTEVRVNVIYAYKFAEPPSVLTVAIYVAFLWPLVLVIASIVWPGLNQRPVLALYEFLLCLGSGYIVFCLIFLGSTLRYGAYVASAAIVAYFITVLREIVARARRKWLQQT